MVAINISAHNLEQDWTKTHWLSLIWVFGRHFIKGEVESIINACEIKGVVDWSITKDVL